MNAERRRLAEAKAGAKPWRRWGAYLSERQWGTVREDYSPDGAAWDSFPYEMSLARAYRWGEDGLAGISDDRQLLCLTLALWNGRDPHLKERLFGLTGPQGNHGEDVKEMYWHLDATPTHSWLEMLYKYPQAEYPYARLVEENRRRSKLEPELEITDSGVFDDDRYFDVRVEVAKAAPEDLLIRIEATNRGPEPGQGDRRLLSLLRGHRMKRVLARMLDESEFLSDHGVRALSKFHQANPYRLAVDGREFTVAYQPGESESGLFGGNSNWRGPVWMPVNYLLWESLRRFHAYYGDDFKIECPTGSGNLVSLGEAADELARRLARLFLPGADGVRPSLRTLGRFAADPHFRDHVLFWEYFHGDSGRGVGASHQTGWTGLIAELLR